MDSPLKRFCEDFVEPADGLALIVGSSIKPGREDRRRRYKRAVGLDLEPGEGVDLVHDLTCPLEESLQGTFAHAECTSVLEHCRKPWLLAENLESALRIGGTLLLSVPFVWREHAYPSDYFRFTAHGVRELFPRIKWSKLLYYGADITAGANRALKGFRYHGYPFFARCEVYGFGVRV